MQVELQHQDLVLMPPKVQRENSELEEAVARSYTASIRSNSIQRITTRRVLKEKDVSPKLNRSIRLLDKRSSLDHEKTSPMFGINGGLVRYMSDVPCYLQHTKVENNDEEKALNFGVINWGRLENWAYNEKHEVDDSEGYWPSTRETSSNFSTSESFSETLRNMNKSPCLNDRSFPSVRGSRVKQSEKNSSRHVRRVPDSKSSLGGMSLRNQQLLEMAGCVGSDHLENQCENGKRKDSRIRITTCSIAEPTSTNSLVPNSEEYETNIRHHKEKVQHSRSSDVGHSDCYEQHNSKSRVSFSKGSPRSCPLLCTTMSDQSESEKPIGKPKVKNVNQSQIAAQFAFGMVGRFSQGYSKLNNTLGGELSHSQIAGPSRMNRSSSVTEGQVELTDSLNISNGEKVKAPSRGRRSSLKRMLDMLPKPKNRISLSGPLVTPPNHDANEVLAAERPPLLEKLVSRHWSNRSFSSTINPSTSQKKENLNLSFQTSNTLLDSVQDDRQERLTRHALLQLTERAGSQLFILSSNANNTLAANINTKIVSGGDDYECLYTISSAHEVKKKSGIWTNLGNKSTKHPLVSNVVAQLKVSGYKTIGSDSKADSVVVEIVLLGAEQIPASNGSINTVFNNELASIIINIPKEESEGILGDVSKNVAPPDSSQGNLNKDQLYRHQAESLKVEPNPEDQTLSGIMVLLPSGVHAQSVETRPSPLIDRWRSGGTCDCGGWDEGCKIAVLHLHDKVQECRSFCDAHDPHQIELFVQGGSGENKHFFSMISCRKDLYMVEVTESIALLQAFAISIATLHSKMLSNQANVQDLLERRNFVEHIFSNNTSFPSYVVQHGHLSPVG